MPDTWMLYGAYGFTGRLILAEAMRRGHRPVVAGRSPDRVAALAGPLGLEGAAVGLDDPALAEEVSRARVVLHAAGPFVRTSDPMIRACLEAGVHYMDITGEIPVFQNTYRYDAEAARQGVALVSGAGFDVVPTDCLAMHVAGRAPGATRLEVAVAVAPTASGGTAKTALGMMAGGVRVRREGRLVGRAWGRGARSLRFPIGMRTIVPAPLADVETAFRSTGIPNITAYVAVPGAVVPAMWLGGSLMQGTMAIAPVRRLAQWGAKRAIHGPSARAQQKARSYAWACASGGQGGEAEAWLDTVETYRFTAAATVRAVEKLLAGAPVGALTPAQAFGADFVLDIEDTWRIDG